MIAMPFRPPAAEGITLSFIIGMPGKKYTPIFTIFEIGWVNFKGGL